MSKHTPGPSSTRYYSNDFNIVAAPDLLQLLRLATETLALETRNGANYDKATHAMLPFKSEGNIDYEELVKLLRNAIAKATGGDE